FARHLENATKFAHDGQNKEALIELRSALQIEPKNADVNFRIAELLAKDGKLADAAFYYRETSRLDPKRTDAMMSEAKLIMFDDRAHADELVDKVLELEPTSSLAYERRSEIALAGNDTNLALKAVLTAIELGPKEGLPQMQLGIVHQARIRETQLKGEKPGDDLYESAVAAFRKADELYGGSMQARVELGRLYGAWAGHEKEAQAAFRGSVEVAGDPLARGRAAGVAINYARGVGNQELLSWALEQMVASVPSNPDAGAGLAGVGEQRQAGGGDAVFKRLLEQRPQDEEGHVLFARFMNLHKRNDEALALLEDEVKNGSDPPLVLEAICAIQISR